MTKKQQYEQFIDEAVEMMIDNELTENEFSHCFEMAAVNVFGVDVTMEGANNDYRKEFNNSKKELKKVVREMRPMVKHPSKKDKSKFDKLAKQAHKIIKDTEDYIEGVPSTVTSAILGYFAAGIFDSCKWLIPNLLTFGLASIVPSVERIIQFVKGIMKGIDDEEDWTDALNMLKQRYLYLLKVSDQMVTRMEKNFEKGLKDEDVKESAFDELNAMISSL